MSLETYSQIPQTNNLISYYPFLGNLEDQSGKNHNTGSINGDPSLTQNRFGTNDAAYYLDGTDDYLYFGNSIYADLPDTDSDGYYEDDYTISIWAKSSVVDNEIFIAFGEADGLYTGMISVIGSTIGFNSSNWGFPSTSTSGKKSDNNWHQYTFVYVAGSFRKLFIDGSLVRQANDTLRRFNFKNYGLSVGIGRFDAAGNPEGIATTYTGSVDDVRMWNVALTNTEVSNLYTYENNPANDFSLSPITAPTAISGTSVICVGDSTSLTASGGTTNSNAVAVWYEGACGDQGFHEGWETQPYGSVATTVNANANGVLNITSTSGDPYINMFNLGSFDPTLYKYINFRYRVVSGTANQGQIFFLNGAMTLASGSKIKWKSLISDGQWHTAVVDMSTHPLWTSDGNITGIRYDYTTASGVTMDLDFIELSSAPIVGTGNTITVSPTANTSYYVNRKGPETNTSCISQLVTVNQIPVITNFNNYSKTYFDESFTIANPTSASAGSFSYTSDNASVATISGNTVTITGVGTANITATQAANGSFCSNTATVPLTVNGVSVVTKYGEISATNSNYVNNYGEIGDITGVSKNGLLLVTKSPFSGGTFDGYTYNVVTTATGRVWLDRNLGATQVASSSTDAASFGDLYQWGRGTDGHEKRTSTNISTVSTTDTPGHGFFINANSFNWQSPVNTELWQGVDGKNNPCPNGFRLPTIEEFEAEVVLWSSQNAAGALASSLKLPIAGRRHTNGSIYSVGSNGIYRTNSTLILNITSTSAARAGDERIDGFCVRCIKD
tara:strand:+ start:96402 stop:98756 length:2355 start_codon:yes stop_codon:yes gene_type:complete